MRPLGREAVVDDDRSGGILKTTLDAVVSQNPIHLGDIERAVSERDAVRHIQPAGDGDDLVRVVVLVAVEHGVDVSGLSRAHEQRAAGRPGHGPRVGHVRRVDLDRESGGQGDPIKRHILRDRCETRGGGDSGRHRCIDVEGINLQITLVERYGLGEGRPAGTNGRNRRKGHDSS